MELRLLKIVRLKTLYTLFSCWNVKTSLHLWRIVPAHENCHMYVFLICRLLVLILKLVTTSGSSVLSRDGRSLLVSNLSNGLNLYSLDNLETPRSFNYTVNPRTNFPLSVAYLRGDKFVTCGTHTGTVRIWNKKTGEIFQTLDHSSERVFSCS